MTPHDAAFLGGYLRRYYYDRFSVVEAPSHIRQREFGYRRVASEMVRHIKISGHEQLRALLMRQVPLDVYASNARYTFPDAPMQEKDWQGAELIFDIDAKDLQMDCRPSHTVRTCGRCGYGGYGEECASCPGGGLRSVSLYCDRCLGRAGEEVGRLLDILREDMGIDSGVHVYFSGNEGFHVHVQSEQYLEIGSQERLDLADYIMCQGITPERLGMKKTKTQASDLASIEGGGWEGRFAKHLFGSKAGRTKRAKEIVAAGYDSFSDTIQSVARSLGVRIDPAVTSDIHRIFRLPGTINGKSGLPKMPYVDTFDIDKILRILPHNDATVRASCPAAFRLGSLQIGPYHNEYVTLPLYAATYMICKGMAHAV